MHMTSRRLMTLQVVVPPPQRLGAVPRGTRVIAPITSGTFEGPRLRGRVLPGGGDWTLLRSDAVLELDLRITLETDDGALISMTSFGLRHGPPEVAAAPPQKLGTVPHGIRSIVPVTGGDFEGPRLRGKVLPGGGDWLLLRPDGVLELDLRITLETDDQALIYMTFQGLRHGSYFRTLPRFETSADAYAFLNRIVSVGMGEARPDGAVHRIDEIL